MPRARALPVCIAAVTAAAVAACSNETPAPPGPAYSPAIADSLKALAADCEIRPSPDGETRACRGRQATMLIELDRERRLRALDIVVVASTGVWEAWTLINNVLPAVAPQPVVDSARKLLSGQPADPVVGGVRVMTTIDGQRYGVKLTWGA